MDRHDGGEAPRAIATAMRLQVNYVRQIIARYDWRALSNAMTDAERQIRAATQELERRIRATGRLHS